MPQSGCKRGEIAVRAHDPEPVYLPLVEQVDRVDRHRHIGGVLSRGQVELLLRADTELVSDLIPLGEVVLGKVAIGALDIHLPQLRHDGKYGIDPARSGIVCVDQQGDVFEVFFGHARSHAPGTARAQVSLLVRIRQFLRF